MSETVAVLMGGWSAERDVSLVSGDACASALESAGYSVRRIDVTDRLGDLVEALTPPPDVVFNALHGRFGEDGNIQAVLNLLRIPYTHSGLLASALAMDKDIAKAVFRAHGIPCPDGGRVRAEALRQGDPMARPYVVKPVNEGSSVGVHIVREGDNRLPLEAWAFGEEVLVEPFIPGRELTVAVMGDRPLGVTELRPVSGFYDYEAKYTAGRTEHLCPAPVAESVAAEAMDLAVRAHAALGCRGVSRADFRYDDTGGEPGTLFMLEVNTQPGMTPLSLVPEQAALVGMSFEALVSWMVENAACDA